MSFSRARTLLSLRTCNSYIFLNVTDASVDGECARVAWMSSRNHTLDHRGQRQTCGRWSCTRSPGPIAYILTNQCEVLPVHSNESATMTHAMDVAAVMVQVVGPKGVDGGECHEGGQEIQR